MDENRLLIKKKELRNVMRSRIKSIVASFGYSPSLMADSVLNRLFSLSGMNNGSFANIMIYLNLPEEFPTLPMIGDLFFRRGKMEKRSDSPCRAIAVPWCSDNDLQLFQLDPFSIQKKKESVVCVELCEGAYHILEPKKDLREQSNRIVDPKTLDLILVPGLAFDPHCGRLGRGAGFYDRFLRKTRDDVLLVGLAFDEQLVDSVPCEPHDRLMDLVLTPSYCFSTSRADALFQNGSSSFRMNQEK